MDAALHRILHQANIPSIEVMMVYLQLAIAALLNVAHVYATPAPAPTPAPNIEHAIARRAACTFSGSLGYSSASVSKGSCSTIVLSNMQVPGGVTLNLEKLNTGTTVIFQGNISFGYAAWEGSLFSVSGTNITVKGAAGSFLDGHGALYWDGLGGNGGVTKPKFFKANNLINSVLDSITILNAPKNSFSLNVVDTLTVKNIVVNNTAGDVGALGHNTDAFNINNGNNILITGAKVWNQDDCVAVNSGTNIVFTKGYCHGGHGLSIGSVGGRSNNVVKNVTFSDTVMEKSQQSVRIKTVSGANGSVDSITYKNIVMSGGDSYGIIVDQSYGGTDGSPTNGVNITNFVLQNVTGTVLSKAIDIYIECGKGSCKNWKWTNVTVTGGKKSTSCLNVPSGISC